MNLEKKELCEKLLTCRQFVENAKDFDRAKDVALKLLKILHEETEDSIEVATQTAGILFRAMVQEFVDMRVK